MLEGEQLNVIALVTPDNERFVFKYDDDSIEETIAQLRAYAADPEISLTWEQASYLTRRIREMEHTHQLVSDRTKYLRE